MWMSQLLCSVDFVRYVQCHALLYKVIMNMRLMNQAFREMQEFVTNSDHVRVHHRTIASPCVQLSLGM